jgi:hypothetical protein
VADGKTKMVRWQNRAEHSGVGQSLVEYVSNVGLLIEGYEGVRNNGKCLMLLSDHLILA